MSAAVGANGLRALFTLSNRDRTCILIIRRVVPREAWKLLVPYEISFHTIRNISSTFSENECYEY